MNAFLEPELKALWPGAAWLSEESVDDTARVSASHVIIVDPIDGTRGFARGDSNWAVAIALCAAGRPICGIVHAPALRETYSAAAGRGATLNGTPLHVGVDATLRPDMRLTCPGNLAKALAKAGVSMIFEPKIASLALRIVKVASGAYDAGFALRNSHDWDLAAADLVLTEAGGILADLAGNALLYNKIDPVHGILTAAPRTLRSTLSEALALTPFGEGPTKIGG